MNEATDVKKLGRNLTVIFGPPGTGKTTRLLDILDGLLTAGVPSRAIAFVSFTRAARAEAVERVERRFGLTKDDLPWFLTLHSAARCFLPGKFTVMKRKEWATFAKQYHYTLSDIDPSEEDDPTALPQTTDDDEIRAALAWGRLRCLTWDETLRQARLSVPAIRSRKFKADLDAFKAARACIDFEDMLERAVELPGARPLVKVAIIDEAQDLSPLLAKTAHHFFADTDRVYVAGDDDQAIYEFQGADPSWLMGLQRVADDVKLLGQSYRIPAVVHELAQRVIGQNNYRVAKAYEPRDVPGKLLKAGTLSEAVRLIPDANGGSEPHSVFVLARNWWTLKSVRQYALDHAIPFGVLKQRNAPLDHAGWVRGLTCAIALSEHRDVFPGDFSALLESVPSRVADGEAIIPHGLKAAVEDLQQGVEISRAELESRWDLGRFFATLDTKGPIGVFVKPTGSSARTHAEIEQVREYFRRLLDRYGCVPAPVWYLSSIHSVKGSEADVVVLLSDMSKKSHEALTREGIDKAEPENRAAYVAVTRARNGLILVDPTGFRAYPYGKLAQGIVSESEVAVTLEEPGGDMATEACSYTQNPLLFAAALTLVRVTRAGGNLAVNTTTNGLNYTGPRGYLSPTLTTAIRNHRAELLVLLAGRELSLATNLEPTRRTALTTLMDNWLASLDNGTAPCHPFTQPTLTHPYPDTRSPHTANPTKPQTDK